jgi:hypothetical protein
MGSFISTKFYIKIDEFRIDGKDYRGGIYHGSCHVAKGYSLPIDTYWYKCSNKNKDPNKKYAIPISNILKAILDDHNNQLVLNNNANHLINMVITDADGNNHALTDYDNIYFTKETVKSYAVKLKKIHIRTCDFDDESLRYISEQERNNQYKKDIDIDSNL